MATQSDMEKEQKHQQDKVQGGLNNKAALASGDACGTENQDPAASVPTVSGQASPSGGAALSSSTAGSSTAATTSAAIFITDEASGLPIIAAVRRERHSDLRECRSPHEVFGCVVPEGGSQAAVGPQKATGHGDEHLAQTKNPRTAVVGSSPAATRLPRLRSPRAASVSWAFAAIFSRVPAQQPSRLRGFYVESGNPARPCTPKPCI
ncbi:PREDICTED: uncharacterized protein CXorf67-like [Rhinopithecus bieti]|uniref:uncharacterized protein CXorf67-like n=1 Tax=Rhinopithecus bieti TaxID=61621 RepID=UPI00083BF9C6|nr:PREDICTED: uncharacterized protein CXorf67-like [Rhinopithecus bieti]